MSELAPANNTDNELAPIVAIGGLLTVKRMGGWYSRLLKDEATDLPPDERFIAPPDRGIGEPDELQKRSNELLERVYERLDRRKMFLVGHSLGGLIATRAAMERPDLIDSVASLGGAHAGYSKETLATFALRYALGNPKEARHLKHDSPFMQEHHEKMASEWPADVPLHIISSPNDVLVVTPHGFDVDLPGKQAADKRLVVTPSPFGVVDWATRRLFRIPDDVESISSLYLSEHVNLPRVPAVVEYVREQRLSPAEVSTLPDAAGSTPVALPAAA